MLPFSQQQQQQQQQQQHYTQVSGTVSINLSLIVSLEKNKNIDSLKHFVVKFLSEI